MRLTARSLFSYLSSYFAAGDSLHSATLVWVLIFVTGFIRALRIRDNTELWRYSCDENCTFGLLQVINGIVYDATGSHFIALRASDGKLLWSYTCVYLCDETDATTDGIYISQNTSQGGLVEGLDSNNGRLLWREQFKIVPLDISLEDNGLLYLQCFKGPYSLYVLQARTGHMLWQRKRPDEIILLQVFDS